MKLRLLGLVLLLGLVAAVVAFLSRETSQRSSFTSQLSSWSAAPRGGRALFELSQRAGLAPQRLKHNLEVIPEEGTIAAVQPRGGGVFLASLFLDLDIFTKDEVQAIGRWVEEGNTFVLVSGSADELYENFGLSLERAAPEPVGQEEQQARARRRARGQKEDTWPPEVTEAWPALPGASLLAQINQLEVEQSAPALSLRQAWRGQEGDRELQQGDGYWPLAISSDGRVLAAEVRLGRGRFVAITSPYVATNGGLGKGDNGLFLARVLGQDGRALHFDEFHHGFNNDRSLAGYLRQSGLWVVVAQLALLLLLLGWRAQNRFGAPLPWFEEELRGTGDYLKAMSQIYQRGHHGDHALRVMVEDLERRLVERFRLPAGTSGEKLITELERAGQEALARRVGETRLWALKVAQGRRREAEVLEAAREVAALAEEISGRAQAPRREQEQG